MYGNPNVTAGGGEALKFFASCRLETNIGKMIEDKRKMPLGVNLRFKNKKSRSFVPGISTEGVQLFFQHGINPVGGLLSILLQSGRIIPYAKGRYQVAEPWADGKEVTFTATMAANQVPLEPFYAAPKLIDAETEEQVREYFGMFEDAIRLASGDSIVEKVVDENGETTQAEFISELTADEE